MTPDRVAKLIERELSRANEEQQIECLHSAERLIQNCMDGSKSTDEIALFNEMLADVQDRIRKHLT
jgi:hypothetical protein